MNIKKISIIALVLSISIVGSATAEDKRSNYEIKESFIQSIDSAAKTHSREALLRRYKLLSINKKILKGDRLTRSELMFLGSLSKRLNKDENDIEDMILATDKIPSGIIISVAIKESKWGTDQIMKKANNPFGLRCFSLGCGIKDERSKLDNVYSELALFKSTVDATRSFTRNLNINSQYTQFRSARKEMRDNGEYLTSLPLAEFIVPFSYSDKSYGRELRKIIHQNKLYYLDN